MPVSLRRAAPDRRAGEHRPFWALYGATPPTGVLQADGAKRPPEGAVGPCHWLLEPMAQPMAYPAAPKRLDSGRYRVSELRRVGANPPSSLSCFHGNSTRRAVGRWPKRWWAGTHPTGPPDSHRHEPQQTGCRSDAVALLDHRSAHTPTKPGVSLKRLLQ